MSTFWLWSLSRATELRKEPQTSGCTNLREVMRMALLGVNTTEANLPSALDTLAIDTGVGAGRTLSGPNWGTEERPGHWRAVSAEATTAGGCWSRHDRGHRDCSGRNVGVGRSRPQAASLYVAVRTEAVLFGKGPETRAGGKRLQSNQFLESRCNSKFTTK